MGDYTIERFLIGTCVYLFILLALVFTKRKRKIFIAMIAVVIVSYAIFFFIRGHLLENQYMRSIELMNVYLERQYPQEEWTVIDTLSKGKKRRSNRVDIVFKNEKEVIYTYKILDDGQITQWEIRPNNKPIDTLKYNEWK